jgi:hypothetical protein
MTGKSQSGKNQRQENSMQREHSMQGEQPIKWKGGNYHWGVGDKE